MKKKKTNNQYNIVFIQEYSGNNSMAHDVTRSHKPLTLRASPVIGGKSFIRETRVN